jgi:hypothetical protein
MEMQQPTAPAACFVPTGGCYNPDNSAFKEECCFDEIIEEPQSW